MSRARRHEVAEPGLAQKVDVQARGDGEQDRADVREDHQPRGVVGDAPSSSDPTRCRRVASCACRSDWAMTSVSPSSDSTTGHVPVGNAVDDDLLELLDR